MTVLSIDQGRHRVLVHQIADATVGAVPVEHGVRPTILPCHRLLSCQPVDRLVEIRCGAEVSLKFGYDFWADLLVNLRLHAVIIYMHFPQHHCASDAIDAAKLHLWQL